MAWLADLAGKAETLLNNLDEQTGAALRSNGPRRRHERELPVPIGNRPASPSTRFPLSKATRTETKPNYLSRKPILSSKPLDQSSNQSNLNNYKKERSMKVLNKPTHDNDPENFGGGAMPSEYYGVRHRRSSLPTTRELLYQQNYAYEMNDVMVENTVLKNELNVLHKEVSQLLDRLGQTEDGNDVVSEQELSKATVKLKTAEQASQQNQVDKISLSAQFEELKMKIHELTVTEMERQKQQCKQLELEVELMKNRNMELENLVRQLNKEASEHESHQIKAEKDIKHAQTTIDELQSDLEKSTAECRRLEAEWEAYKSRVKSTLAAKDKEIKQLQQGLNLTEDTKILIEQLEVLKEEREELTELVASIRRDSRETRQHVEALESRCDAAERVVAALREALKDERSLKTRADAQVAALTKELKALQSETNQTLFALHATLREKDSEISHLKEIAAHSADTSALNVADYDDQASIDHEKIHYLTQTLVQRQGKIDSLLADNNMLRIQMEKLECKYKSELSALRTRNSHSVVQLQHEERSRRTRQTGFFGGLSVRIGHMFRYPVFRMFVLFYMLGLHFWVITVLLTSTPDVFNKSLRKENLDRTHPFQT
ncbi:golgin subfamily A member 5-like [Leguminivora glycinivorella]|uniref:golgin subfamily A member 5-like n=1 Tax=Leguminivora glycinivorella TaxID=1035111 RepID=UPI00200C0BC6|nr:golgin subfamily A member 5-like [Leguminivora glycinivorella]